jgi:hypothetical protein
LDAIESAVWETEVDNDPMIVTSVRLPKSPLDLGTWSGRRRTDQANRTSGGAAGERQRGKDEAPSTLCGS